MHKEIKQLAATQDFMLYRGNKQDVSQTVVWKRRIKISIFAYKLCFERVFQPGAK